MDTADLTTLLKPHETTLQEMAKQLTAGDRAGFIGSTITLVTALATANPHIVLLAPFASKAASRAFSSAADDFFRRQLAQLEAEEGQRAFVSQIADAVELLICQAVLQVVRVQHNVKAELLEALGGVREDFADFRERFQKEIESGGDFGEAVRVDVQTVGGGAIGIRVGANARRRVFVSRMEVAGNGSIGIDLS
ncbi:hypothetical protein WMF45_48185 [Sorangium sp. So ce448]|uniref:hypothetical protein n=1 Tax=Sorangium sp. So ce448 TaxID=3133314 RepID=UPI003F6481E6